LDCLPVELAVSVSSEDGQFGKSGPVVSHILAAIFFLVSLFFVWRSFHKMRIRRGKLDQTAQLK
jgi:K(+)-stimulated pyrophosphate-energized sodium pump